MDKQINNQLALVIELLTQHNITSRKILEAIKEGNKSNTSSITKEEHNAMIKGCKDVLNKTTPPRRP